MNQADSTEEIPEEEEEEKYETTPEAATGAPSGPNIVNLAPAVKRKDVMMVIGIGFAVIVMAGLVFSSVKSKQKNTPDETAANAARTPQDFLRRERDRAGETPAAGGGSAPEEGGGLEAGTGGDPGGGGNPEGPRQPSRGGLPEVTVSRETGNPPPDPPPARGGGGGGPAPPPFTANRAPLVPPVIEGSVFGASVAAAAPPPQAAPPYPAPAYPAAQSPAAYPAQDGGYSAQNNQGGKQAFYNAAAGGDASGGDAASGRFTAGNALWIGTIIPAVLQTAVNTDLPGNVIARVTQNVYDSRTGKNLLIPQGTLLTARYNSSVSYAQHRVQIAWDTMTRPDGYHVELGGMPGVDAQGMAGAAAEYRENWFEYLKAAGIIAMFSVANSKMAEEAAKYGSEETASAVVQSNAQLVNQLGGNIVGRAMNIQPTLILPSGEKIFIMLNRHLFLPPVTDTPVTQKYLLRRF